MKSIGSMLGNEIGPFVKLFIVSLQIYMCDTVNSIKLTAKDCFEVISHW